MRTPDEKHYLFCEGNSFYFSFRMPPRSNQISLTYEGFWTQSISDEQFGGIAFVKKEGRIGIFLFDSGDDLVDQYLWKANTFPFMYDEVWMPWYTEYEDVYIAVRIGTKWGVLRLYDLKNYHYAFKGWCVPLEYPTREDAIKAIKAKYDPFKLCWESIELKEPFVE